MNILIKGIPKIITRNINKNAQIQNHFISKFSTVNKNQKKNNLKAHQPISSTKPSKQQQKQVKSEQKKVGNQQKANLKQKVSQKQVINPSSGLSRRQSLLLQTKLASTYTQLQCLPSDSYQNVVQSYKRLKKRLMSRQVYLPNKPQVLDRIDKGLQLIKQHHVVWRAPSTRPNRLKSDNKAHVIEYQMEHAKQNYYLSWLQNQKILSAFALGFILFIAACQHYLYIQEEYKGQKAPKLWL